MRLKWEELQSASQLHGCGAALCAALLSAAALPVMDLGAALGSEEVSQPLAPTPTGPAAKPIRALPNSKPIVDLAAESHALAAVSGSSDVTFEHLLARDFKTAPRVSNGELNALRAIVFNGVEGFVTVEELRKRFDKFPPTDAEIAKQAQYVVALLQSRGLPYNFELARSLNATINARSDRPELQSIEDATRRIVYPPFDMFRTDSRNFVEMPEFADVLSTDKDATIAFYNIGAEKRKQMKEQTFNPECYPFPIPHDFDLGAVAPPTENEVIRKVKLCELKHPYDWHILRMPVHELRDLEEVDRLIHLVQQEASNYDQLKNTRTILLGEFSRKLMQRNVPECELQRARWIKACEKFFANRSNMIELFFTCERAAEYRAAQQELVRLSRSHMTPEQIAKLEARQAALDESLQKSLTEKSKQYQQKIDGYLDIPWYVGVWSVMRDTIGGFFR